MSFPTKGGHNPPNTSTARPKPPQGSGGGGMTDNQPTVSEMADMLQIRSARIRELHAALEASTRILRNLELYFADNGTNITELIKQRAANEAALKGGQ